jgi:hypothetical protein
VAIRYCLRGHCEENFEPIYFATRRPEVIRQRQMARAAEALRQLRVQYCDCGAKLISECPNCGYPLKPGRDDAAPMHCGSCAQRFPWAEDSAAVQEPEDPAKTFTIHAPVALSQRIKDAFIKVRPAAGKVVTDVVTKALTTEATSHLDKLLK